jgi:hypothetical protein
MTDFLLLPHTMPPLTPCLKLLMPVWRPAKGALGPGRLAEGCDCSRRPKGPVSTPCNADLLDTTIPLTKPQSAYVLHSNGRPMPLRGCQSQS